MSDIELLIVPADVIAGLAGVINPGLKSTLRSYEITPNPVTSPTVIGIVIADPAAPLTAGSETVTVPNAADGPAVLNVSLT